MLLERLEALSRVRVFERLSAEDLLRLAQLLEEKHVSPDESVFEEGQAGDEMYLVAEGDINLLRPKDGAVLAQLGPGASFGEMALFENTPRSASARAATGGRLLVLSRRVLMGLIQERPDISFSLLADLSHRLRETTARLA